MEDCHGKDSCNGIKDVDIQGQTKGKGKHIAYYSLPQSHGKQGEQISPNEVACSERGRVQSLEKGTFPILGKKCGGK